MYSFYDEIILRLGLPLEETTFPRITMFYNQGLVIEGHKGLLDYNESEIIVRIQKEKIRIFGKKMIAKEITDDQMVICGKISSIGMVDEKK